MKKAFFLSLILLVAFTAAIATNSQEKAPQESEITLKDIEPFTYCCIKHQGPFTEIEKVIGQLMPAMQGQNIAPTGPMLGVYYNNPEEVKPEELLWEIGFPVTPQVAPQPPLEKITWNYTLVASAIHVGPYETSGETYQKIFDWLEVNGYVQVGPLLEKYLTIPVPDTKPEDLRSEIWVPCQKK